MDSAAKLRVSNLCKSFPGVKALDGVSLSVKHASIHAVCGENGAGKSTLMKVMLGVHRPDSGQIFINEKPVEIRHPLDARRHGVSMIFQELNYVPEMTVEESFFLGNWPSTKLGQIKWREIRSVAAHLLKTEGLTFPPDARLSQLSTSQLQMLEIVKAVSHECDIIFMDEPTSSITLGEAELLFRKIAQLKARGASIVYISHKMEEIFRLADEITVMRDGKVIDSRPREAYDPQTLITQMVGRELQDVRPLAEHEAGNEALRVDGLSKAGRFSDVSFHIRAGEIVGFAGLVGAGRTDVMRCLFGIDQPDKGKIWIKGESARPRAPYESIGKGMAMLSEDRARDGIIAVRPVRENVALGDLTRFFYAGRLHATEENTAVSELCRKMNVKAASMEVAIGTLSGGNQQKTLLARSLLANPQILLLDEPTRGIDVGARQEIYQLLRQLAKEGKAQALVSSDLPELLLMCDRIYVMARGKIMGMLGKSEFSQQRVMALATGGTA